MATSIKRSPYTTPPSGKAYRLEMEGRTLFLLIGLMAFTGVVIFALGVATGMGMREPVRNVPIATVEPSNAPSPDDQKPTEEPSSLTFGSGVKKTEGSVEGLAVARQQAENQTQSLLNRAEKELKLEEVPTAVAPPSVPATPNTPAAPVQPTKPEVSSPESSGDSYTVQVFSSNQRENAQELQAKLKKMGFPAYMNQFQGADNQTWFRVRVGKGSRSEVEALADQLRKKGGIKDPQVIRQ